VTQLICLVANPTLICKAYKSNLLEKSKSN